MKIDTLNEYLNTKNNILEIGGPSLWLLPFYNKKANFLFFNYMPSLICHTNLSNEYLPGTYKYGDAVNEQDLKILEDSTFDLILNSHILEHIANPIKALNLWKNFLYKNDVIITIVPDKRYCWDKNRNYTTYEHLLEDYYNNTSENDMTHLEDASCMMATRPTYFLDVGKDNDKRIIHHHVYSNEVLQKIHEFVGYETLFCENLEQEKLHLVYIGIKK